MAIPRVFISSTCYDLKYIRENLKYFVKTIGYEPILSEDGAVFYNPVQHTHDSCLSEVPNCQIFVLIIGGRYGGKFKESETSITNEEYREAVKQKIPVFALVENAVYSDHNVFSRNKKNENIDEEMILYPSADNTKIFSFIDEVRSNSINNAIVPFRDFSDIENYLKQQWAGMMFSFLSSKNEDTRVSDMMTHLMGINERIEFMSSQLVKSIGSPEAILLVSLYERMVRSKSTKCFFDIGLSADPVTVLKSNDMEECASNLGKELIPVSDVDFSISSNGEIDKIHLNWMSKDFNEMKVELESMLQESNLSIEQLESYQKKA